MKQIIETQLSTTTALTAGSLIPIGSVIHKQGCNLSANGSTITVKGSGYFKVTANVTVEPSAVADMTITLNKNGTPIATSSATPAVASDSVNITLIGVIYNSCGCASDALTLSLGSAGSVTNANVIVERM